MFGATSLESGKILHNFEGSWILGMPFGKDEAVLEKITPVLSKAFTVSRSANIKGMKYLKVFVNANNCLPAILGLSIQEAFSDVDISAIAMSIWKEGLGVVQKAGLTLESLPDFPIERLMKLTSFSTQEAARVYSGIMQGLSREPLYGSVLQSIKRGKRTEIDYFNGEFVHLAKSSGSSAPLNAKLVEMVHEVEKTGRFFSKGELLQAIKGLNNKK
jgi:2-dehydropantoate 2-reductase